MKLANNQKYATQITSIFNTIGIYRRRREIVKFLFLTV